MFQRAVKLKFNEQKYLHTSIVRLIRLEDSKVSPAADRYGLIIGLCLLPALIRWYRKSPSHKVCYTPLRKGLNKLKDDPFQKVLAKGEVSGYHYGPKGRVWFP